MADIPSLDELGNGSNSVLDRDIRIQPSGPINIDVVDSKPLQGIGQEVLDRPGARINSYPGTIRAAHSAKLYGEDSLVSPVFQSPAKQHLIVAHPVEVAGIQK